VRSEAIDILKLYAGGSHSEWNAFLSRALDSDDVPGLTDVLRRLQMGMDDLVRQKLNTERVNVLFLRLQRSVENTLRDIHRKKYANPLYTSSDKALHRDHLEDKRRKQRELETFLRKVRY